MLQITIIWTFHQSGTSRNSPQFRFRMLYGISVRSFFSVLCYQWPQLQPVKCCAKAVLILAYIRVHQDCSYFYGHVLPMRLGAAIAYKENKK